MIDVLADVGVHGRTGSVTGALQSVDHIISLKLLAVVENNVVTKFEGVNKTVISGPFCSQRGLEIAVFIFIQKPVEQAPVEPLTSIGLDTGLESVQRRQTSIHDDGDVLFVLSLSGAVVCRHSVTVVRRRTAGR